MLQDVTVIIILIKVYKISLFRYVGKIAISFLENKLQYKIYKIIMSQDVTVLMYIKEWVVNGERKNNYF